MAQSWERILFTTGGAINLQKSFWILLTWQWWKGIAKLSIPTQEPAQLLLTAGYGRKPVQVPQLNPLEGFRTLGVFTSPSRSTKLARAKLKAISVEYATALMGSCLNYSAALWSYLLYLIPKLTYSTPALTLTEQECHDIQSPSIMTVLPRLHVNRNTARSIIFSPASYGRLGLPTVYSEQSFGQLAYFTGHINLADKTGRLLLISFCICNYSAGVSVQY
jgi:hypothetical protein